MKNRSTNRREMGKARQGLVVVISIMLAAVLLGICAFLYQNTVEEVVVEEVVEVKDLYGDYTYIRYNGEDYAYNKNITTLLFMGIDQESGSDEIGRSDTMFLALLDEEEETITLLHISRNTMCEVEVVSESGSTVLMSEMQITLQYTYGDGSHTSCALSSDAVSRLLYDIPVDYYLAMELDGIDSIVNSIGNVSMYMEEDYTYIDEVFVQGTTVSMSGTQVESFVRYRETEESGGDEERSLRQEIFIQAFLEQLNEKVGGSTSRMLSVWEDISPYCHTDLYTHIIEMLMTYEVAQEIYEVPGETTLNGSYDEYYVDETALQEVLIQLLYIKQEE